MWPAQAWFPILLKCLVEYPVLLPRYCLLLTDPFNRLHLLIQKGQLQLAVWKVSSNVNQQKAFQVGLLNSFWQGGARPPIQLTSHRGSGGIAGVLEEGLIPFHVMSESFLDFLADLYEEGLEHRTVNSIQSAVSMTHCHVEGVPIGQHPLVTRLIKGVYNSRLPRPCYSATWDVDSVHDTVFSIPGGR